MLIGRFKVRYPTLSCSAEQRSEYKTDSKQSLLSHIVRCSCLQSFALAITHPVPFPPCQKISILTNRREDDYVKASPANMRAVLETVAALEKEGHECIEFQVPQRKHT